MSCISFYRNVTYFFIFIIYKCKAVRKLLIRSYIYSKLYSFCGYNTITFFITFFYIFTIKTFTTIHQDNVCRSNLFRIYNKFSTFNTNIYNTIFLIINNHILNITSFRKQRKIFFDFFSNLCINDKIFFFHRYLFYSIITFNTFYFETIINCFIRYKNKGNVLIRYFYLFISYITC